MARLFEATRDGRTVADGPLTAWPKISWPVPACPPVTLIVPTRDRVGLVRTCLDGLLGATDYPDLDVIIVDNDSAEPETLAYFETIVADPRVSVLPVPGIVQFFGPQ